MGRDSAREKCRRERRHADDRHGRGRCVEMNLKRMGRAGGGVDLCEVVVDHAINPARCELRGHSGLPAGRICVDGELKAHDHERARREGLEAVSESRKLGQVEC